MPAWNDYSTKDTPADGDTLMIKDNAATGYPNKRVLFSKLWDWVMSKTYAFTQGTSDIPTAINTLSSGKVAVSQGSANAGKALVINSSGNVEPGDDINDLADAIGDLTDLDTTAKTDLVSAINETLENAGVQITVSGTTLEIT